MTYTSTPETRYVDVKGTRLRLLVSDNGYERWLVLWPGLGGTAEQFIPFLCSGKDNRVNVIAVDPPGHGSSDMWKGEFTEASVQLIWKSIFETFGAKRALIGGHSYGACCALMNNTLLLDEVEGIILFDGGYFGPGPSDKTSDEFEQENQAFIEGCEFNSWEEFIDSRRQETDYWNDNIELMHRSGMTEINGKIRLRVDIHAAVQASILINSFSPRGIPRSEKPSLLLRATLPEQLNADREKGVFNLSQRLLNLRTVPVPNSGHDVIWENPVFVLNTVWSFITQCLTQ